MRCLRQHLMSGIGTGLILLAGTGCTTWFPVGTPEPRGGYDVPLPPAQSTASRPLVSHAEWVQTAPPPTSARPSTLPTGASSAPAPLTLESSPVPQPLSSATGQSPGVSTALSPPPAGSPAAPGYSAPQGVAAVLSSARAPGVEGPEITLAHLIQIALENQPASARRRPRRLARKLAWGQPIRRIFPPLLRRSVIAGAAPISPGG